MPVRISKNRVSLENIPLNLAAEVDVASATTCNIGSATSNNVRITGTTTITAFDTVASGIIRFIRFSGALTLTHNATTLKLPGSSNITTSADDRAIARSFGSGNWEVFDYQKASGEAIVGSGNSYSLTNLLYPSSDGHWRDIYRAGWRPAFFNQQWGGAQWGGGPDGSKVDFATGHINGARFSNVAGFTNQTWVAQGFKTSEAVSLAAVWVKLNKIGNPTNNLGMYILSDDGSGTKPTGSTPITNGTATAQSGKLHTANSYGEWVRFVFPTPPSLSANTTYHIALNSSGAVDSSNHWGWFINDASSDGKYPHGNYSSADGTPTWTTYSASENLFLIEPSSSNYFLQSSGQFDQKLVFAEGSPLDQSKGLCQPLRNFFDGKEFTYRGVFTSLTKDKTVADFVYGLDHDRVVLRCNATTGYMQVDVYESDGTKHTVTGTTDCSSGTKDIAIYIRAKGDGSDVVRLYVAGASEGTPVTGATITFSTEFRDLGTAWIGGGFPIAPTWTKDTAMGSLPSADGWTWNGTVAEANGYSVSGGKGYQNKNGYAATDTGYWTRTTSFSNANGWTVVWKGRIGSDNNTSQETSRMMWVKDGAKFAQVLLHEYYLETLQLSTNHNVQVNLADGREHVVALVGKGSDFFLFVDGRLAIDGTGLMTTATATNELAWGDNDATSGSNADVVDDYIKEYNTAWLPPQFTAGSLSEAAFFSGDRTGILASLYNGGTLKSTREYCGIGRNYVERVIESVGLKGVTSGPTTTSTTPTLLTDMEAFIIGEYVSLSLEHSANVNGTTVYTTVFADGSQQGGEISHFVPDTNYKNISVSFKNRLTCGLHKLEGRWYVASGTGSSYGQRRNFNFEVR